MRIMQFESGIYDVAIEKQLKCGVDYIIPRELISYYASISDGHLTIQKYDIPNTFDPDKDWNGKRLLIHRSGSAGDLLFITPLIQELKQRWPECRITFNCEKRYVWVLKNNPDVDVCVTPPLLREEINAFDAQIDLESASEFHPLANKKILTDVYAAVPGIELPKDHRTLYTPQPIIVDTIARRYPKTTQLRVGISLMSDGLIRNYPYKNNIEVIKALMGEGIQVVLLGKFKTGIRSTPLFIDMASEKPVLTWEESTAFMKTCDLVLGPDSSAIHFAGAMGIPSLGLYGPFLANLRIPPQPATQAIQGTGPCSPCFHHGRGNEPFPPNGPCKKTEQCDVLASIPPQQVIEKIFDILGIEPKKIISSVRVG